MRLAQQTLWAACMGDGRGSHQLSFRYQGEWADTWLDATDGKAITRLMDTDDCTLTLVPRLEPGDTLVGPASCLWAKLTSRAQLRKLEQLQPLPTLLLRAGESVHRTAVWALRDTVDQAAAEAANKRIAHFLGSKKSDGECQRTVRTPGSVLRVGRESRPLLVSAEYVDVDGLWTVDQVSGRLADPPAPRDWREFRRAA